jgi:hypothetical protein
MLYTTVSVCDITVDPVAPGKWQTHYIAAEKNSATKRKLIRFAGASRTMKSETGSSLRRDVPGTQETSAAHD